MNLTTFGQVSSFTASTIIFQKGDSASWDSGMLWLSLLKAVYTAHGYLLKICSPTLHFVVNSLASLTLKDMRCRKNSTVGHKMICVCKCFSKFYPGIFAIVSFLDFVTQKEEHWKSTGYYHHKIWTLSCRSKGKMSFDLIAHLCGSNRAHPWCGY